MQTTRLREVRNPAPHNGEVIDVSFAVAPRRAVWRRIKVALLAVLFAAAIGFLIPPLWLAGQHIAPLLSH